MSGILKVSDFIVDELIHFSGERDIYAAECNECGKGTTGAALTVEDWGFAHVGEHLW